MPPTRDYPKLLTPEIQDAIADHDLGEAVRAFGDLANVTTDPLALWAELLDELARYGLGWNSWADHWPGGESGLERAVYFLVVGVKALQDESYEHAGYFLQRCAEARPESAVPLAYMGIMQERMGCPAEALMHYRTCLVLVPGLSSVLNATGNLLHELGFYDEAYAHYAKAKPLLVEPTNQATLLGNMGNSLRAMGQLEAAIAAYEEALLLDPAQAPLSMFLAEALLEGRRPAEAVAALNAALCMPSADGWAPDMRRRAHGLLARGHAAKRDFVPATLHAWRQAGHQLDEEDRDGISGVMRGLYAWSVVDHDDPTVACLLARMNRVLGQLDAALSHATRAAKLAPDHPDHFLELGATLWLQKKTPVALEAFEEAAALAPARADIHVHRALASWEEDPADAAMALSEAMRLEPNEALHHCDMAYLHQASGDLQSARKSFQQALLRWDAAPILYGPHGPAAQRGCYVDVIEAYGDPAGRASLGPGETITLANYAVLAGRPTMGRQVLLRLLAEHPTHADGLRNYAWLLGQAGQTREARAVWQRVLAVDPDDGPSRFFALRCQAAAGGEAQAMAIADLRRWLDRCPTDPLARLLLAKLIEPDAEALEHFGMMTKTWSGLYSTWYWHGQCLYHRRQAAEATASLTRSVALNGRFAPARLLLARCLRQQDRVAEAHVETATADLLSGRVHAARAGYLAARELAPDLESAQAGLERVERRLQRLIAPSASDLYRALCLRYRVGRVPIGE